jgi:FtsZ-interacting cell division protein ZipA
MKLETDDPVKSTLLRKSSQYREELEDEAKSISDRTEKIIKNAVIVGGSLALAYFLYNQLATSKKKKSKNKKAASVQSTANEVTDDEEEDTSPANKMLSQIGTALVSQASVFLLSLAKEKLAEYLQAQTEKKKDEHS